MKFAAVTGPMNKPEEDLKILLTAVWGQCSGPSPYVCPRECVCVWIESRSLQRITLLFIVRINPRYERNPSTTYETRDREEGGEKEGRDEK